MNTHKFNVSLISVVKFKLTTLPSTNQYVRIELIYSYELVYVCACTHMIVYDVLFSIMLQKKIVNFRNEKNRENENERVVLRTRGACCLYHKQRCSVHLFHNELGKKRKTTAMIYECLYIHAYVSMCACTLCFIP